MLIRLSCNSVEIGVWNMLAMAVYRIRNIYVESLFGINVIYEWLLIEIDSFHWFLWFADWWHTEGASLVFTGSGNH